MTEQTDTTTKVKIRIKGRCEVETMHLMDTEAKDKEALCQAKASTSVRRADRRSHALWVEGLGRINSHC